MTKFCKDCKHLSSDMYGHWCQHPSFGVALDSGKVVVHLCKIVRNDEYLCGESANWFDPKPQRFQSFSKFNPLNLFK